MKLYEIILRKIGLWKDPIQEERISNPLDVKSFVRVSSKVHIDTLDLKDDFFSVKEIRESFVDIGDGHKFVDYVLESQIKDDFSLRLRVVPGQEPIVLVLNLYEEMGYSQDFHNIVTDESNELVFDDENAKYFRCVDNINPTDSTVTTMTDADGNGRVEPSEVKTEKILFWDYYRQAVIEGVEKEEFVIVEMHGENGWFQIWRGTKVNVEKVTIS